MLQQQRQANHHGTDNQIEKRHYPLLEIQEPTPER
jgi:hypothetical protein